MTELKLVNWHGHTNECKMFSQIMINEFCLAKKKSEANYHTYTPAQWVSFEQWHNCFEKCLNWNEAKKNYENIHWILFRLKLARCHSVELFNLTFDIQTKRDSLCCMRIHEISCLEKKKKNWGN